MLTDLPLACPPGCPGQEIPTDNTTQKAVTFATLNAARLKNLDALIDASEGLIKTFSPTKQALAAFQVAPPPGDKPQPKG